MTTRTKRIAVLFSDVEYEELRTRAFDARTSVATYLRQCALPAPERNKNTQPQKLEAKKGSQKVKTFDECLAEDIAAQRTTAMALADEWEAAIEKETFEQKQARNKALLEAELAKRHSPLLDD